MIYIENDMKEINYIVLMEWDENNRTIMKWGRGETLDDIYDGLSFYKDEHPNMGYEIYEVNKVVERHD